MSGPPPKPWDPPADLKFLCPLGIHKHKVSMCPEFFNLSPLDRWEKIEKGRMCYSYLKPKNVCRGKKCSYISNIPEVLKCPIGASGQRPKDWLCSAFSSVNKSSMEIPGPSWWI